MFAINYGKSRDPFMLECLREIVWVSAEHECLIKAQYIKSAENKLPDLLSRWYNGAAYRREFKKLTSNKKLKHRTVLLQHINFRNVW